MSNKRLSNLIHEAYSLQEDMEALNKRLTAMKAKFHFLTTVDIPEAMTEMGSTYTELDDGSGLSCDVAHKIYGSLPGRDRVDDRAAAIDYLKSNGGEELIVSTVEVEFAKGDISNARLFTRWIAAKSRLGEIKAFVETPVSPLIRMDSTVNPMSLQAWGRRKVKANESIDLSVAGLRGQTQATIKKARAP